MKIKKLDETIQQLKANPKRRSTPGWLRTTLAAVTDLEKHGDLLWALRNVAHGEGFKIVHDQIESDGGLTRVRSRIHTWARKQNPPRNYATRKVEDNTIFVWRLS